MATFVVSKFDPDTDESRPKLGLTITRKDGVYVVKKVGHCLTSDLVAELMTKTESVIMAKGEFANCLSQDHPTRPGVTWLVWVDKVESPSEME